MNTCIIIKKYCKHDLQIQDLHSIFKARPQRAHGTLEGPTALPQCAVQTPSRGVVFVHVQNNRHRMRF